MNKYINMTKQLFYHIYNMLKLLKNYKKHCVRTCFIFNLCYNDKFILN